MSIKYLASYEGPSYGSLDNKRMDGFTSLFGAMRSMRNRQNGWDDVYTFVENDYGVFESDVNEYTEFPSTTEYDVMWLYWAIDYEELDGETVWSSGYTLGNVAYMIEVGPRGGIRPVKA